MLRILAMVSGLAGAAGLSQFPEFSQQYLQRLAGKVDQLEVQVAEIDASAASLDMTRAEYLADLAQSRSGAQASEKAAGEISLFERLSESLASLRNSTALDRLLKSPQAADVDLAQKTWEDFEPAVPLTTEGAAFTAAGFFAGWGVWSFLQMILGWPFRRRRRKREAAAAAAYYAQQDYEAETDDAQWDNPEEDDLDAAPALVEYFGDSRAALDQKLPEASFPATDGSRVDLASLLQPVALFTLPMIGRPGEAFPRGWDSVEGGENGAMLACSFRDAFELLEGAGISQVFGLSTSPTRDQQEAIHRLALPFRMLSDPDLMLAQAMDMPCFRFGDEYFYEPAVYVMQKGVVRALMHPLRDPASAAPRLATQLTQARERATG